MGCADCTSAGPCAYHALTHRQTPFDAPDELTGRDLCKPISPTTVEWLRRMPRSQTLDRLLPDEEAEEQARRGAQ